MRDGAEGFAYVGGVGYVALGGEEGGADSLGVGCVTEIGFGGLGSSVCVVCELGFGGGRELLTFRPRARRRVIRLYLLYRRFFGVRGGAWLLVGARRRLLF